MPSTLTSIVEADPVGVNGTFDAYDVRLALLGNTLPGLFAAGDFAVSQRASGANMSVDIAQGRAFLDPQGGTHQGLYLARRTNANAYNTLADGGMTWTASDISNPRIDVLGIQLFDTSVDGSGVTGWKFSVQTGTPSASATHQLEAQLWPAFPTGFLPLAAILRPTSSTSITTSQITNLNPIAGGRATSLSVPTAETTASTTYTRLATPDAVLVYVPSNGRVRLAYKAQWKVSVASGTQGVAVFVDGVQAKVAQNAGAPAAVDYTLTLGTFMSHLATEGNAGFGSTSVYGFMSIAGVTADVSDVATGMITGAPLAGASANASLPLEIVGLSAGWHAIEVRFKTSANTLTVQNRRTWAEVIG